MIVGDGVFEVLMRTSIDEGYYHVSVTLVKDRKTRFEMNLIEEQGEVDMQISGVIKRITCLPVNSHQLSCLLHQYDDSLYIVVLSSLLGRYMIVDSKMLARYKNMKIKETWLSSDMLVATFSRELENSSQEDQYGIYIALFNEAEKTGHQIINQKHFPELNWTVSGIDAVLLGDQKIIVSFMNSINSNEPTGQSRYLVSIREDRIFVDRNADSVQVKNSILIVDDGEGHKSSGDTSSLQEFKISSLFEVDLKDNNDQFENQTEMGDQEKKRYQENKAKEAEKVISCLHRKGFGLF